MKEITLKISGAITIGEGDIQIHNMVRNAIQEGYQIIVLDMEGVSYMDSSAVGELAASFASAKGKGVEMALTRLQPRIKKLLQMMSFLEVFQVYTSNEDALQIMTRHIKEKEKREE